MHFFPLRTDLRSVWGGYHPFGFLVQSKVGAVLFPQGWNYSGKCREASEGWGEGVEPRGDVGSFGRFGRFGSKESSSYH